MQLTVTGDEEARVTTHIADGMSDAQRIDDPQTVNLTYRRAICTSLLILVSACGSFIGQMKRAKVGTSAQGHQQPRMFQGTRSRDMFIHMRDLRQ